VFTQESETAGGRYSSGPNCLPVPPCAFAVWESQHHSSWWRLISHRPVAAVPELCTGDRCVYRVSVLFSDTTSVGVTTIFVYVINIYFVTTATVRIYNIWISFSTAVSPLTTTKRGHRIQRHADHYLCFRYPISRGICLFNFFTFTIYCQDVFDTNIAFLNDRKYYHLRFRSAALLQVAEFV
jgi:hypothetical protein